MKNAKKIKYSKKHRHESESGYYGGTDIMMMLIPSILVILACMVCIVGLTWAWFTASEDAHISKITASDFDTEIMIAEANLSAVISNIGSNETENTVHISEFSSESGNVYRAELERGKVYDIHIKVADETKIDGYCLITGDDKTYYTEMSPDGYCIITLCTATGHDESEMKVAYYFRPCWGKPTYSDITELKDGDTIGQPVVNTQPSTSKNAGSMVNSDSQESTATSSSTIIGAASNSVDTNDTLERKDECAETNDNSESGSNNNNDISDNYSENTQDYEGAISEKYSTDNTRKNISESDTDNVNVELDISEDEYYG